MNAVRVRPPISGDQLRVSAVKAPEPGPGHVRVRLKAAALNHRELLILAGTWPEWGEYTLGSDGAGVVDAIGDGVSQIELGDEVVINPGINWGENNRAPGPSFITLGGPSDGTPAEATVVPAANVNLRPSYLTWEEAAAIPLAGVTAYRALVVRAKLIAGEVLLVHGIGGGVAQAALGIAKAIGTTVIVTSSQDDKLDRAQASGADHLINYRSLDWAQVADEVTNGRGPDVILDSVGADTLSRSVETVRAGGRVVSLGVTSGVQSKFTIRPLYVRHVDLLGTTLGSPIDFAAMLEFYVQHQIRPNIDRVLPLKAIGEGMAALQTGKQFGKVVLSIAEAFGTP